MNCYTVRRSKLSLFIGYFLAEGLLVVILAALGFIWCNDPSYLDWPLAVFSFFVVALFFNILLLIGSFYKIQVNGDTIVYHAFLRKPKQFQFSDISHTKVSTGLDVKIVGHHKRCLFYIKLSDRNSDRFMDDIRAL